MTDMAGKSDLIQIIGYWYSNREQNPPAVPAPSDPKLVYLGGADREASRVEQKAPATAIEQTLLSGTVPESHS